MLGSLLLAPAAAADPGGSAAVGGQLLARRGTLVLPRPGMPPIPTGITASSWLVADLDTGQVLAARDPHGQFPPASTLKALTALTLIPRLPARQVVTATNADIDVDGSKVGLVPKGRYSVAQLFTALLVVSGNDAANTLASAGGGTSSTVARMNEEAARLQARDTTARTASGLDAPGQLTSAYDLALIARAGMRLPAFRHYVAIRRAFLPAPGRHWIEIGTHNRLLRNYPGAIGIKNGYTVASQATFIGAARRGGRTLVVTMLHASPRVWHEAAALLDWGFAAAVLVTPVGELVEPVPAGSTPVDAVPSGTPAPAAATRARTAGPAPRPSATVGLLAGAGGVVVAVMALLIRQRNRSPRYR